MATTRTVKVEVVVPQVADIANSPYKRFANEIAGIANPLFRAIATPENVLRCVAITDGSSLPAVAAVAETVKLAYDTLPSNARPTFDRAKQLAGVIVCRMMELNGYEKAGVKRTVPHPSFRVAEVYRKVAPARASAQSAS